MTANPLQPLIDALQSAWPQVDGTSLATAADQLLRGQSATVGTSTASLSIGQDNNFSHATISIGNIAGGNLTKIVVNAPYIPLQELLYHHESSTIFRNRLEGFVGREQEIAEIRARIAQVMPTGGYVTITAQAGEGKSSVIARMVEQDGPEQTAFHFIALTPGREYQLGILRTLTARLIVKHGLSATYFPEQSYPAMRDFLPYVLRQLDEQGIHEIIYVDGLDQLDPELNGIRDLSFLPTNPPPGIVFVLGTRPDDTLKPLEVMKPQHEYRLPHLSYGDFCGLLAQKTQMLAVSERLYQALSGNVFYLSLVARELQAGTIVDLDTFIERISDNPDNLFGFAIDRLRKRDRVQWKTVLAPVLALLLVAQEALDRMTMRGLLMIEDGELRDGLSQLGGLVAQDSNGRSFLYHLKIRAYLQEDSSQPEKPFVVSQAQIASWHAQLAAWCVQDVSCIEEIWVDTLGPEQIRRWYARHHYITHLALGQQWEILWSVVDNGSYGRHKRRFDPSTRLYTQDLDRARDSAANQRDLAHLWRWSLLRVSLTSRIDKWPDDLFIALIYLGRRAEAMSRVELLSDADRKVRLFCSFIFLFDKEDAHPLWRRAQDTIKEIDDEGQRAEALVVLGTAQANIGLWGEAYATANLIHTPGLRAEALSELAKAYAEAGLWKEGYATASNIDDQWLCTQTLRSIAAKQARDHSWEAARVAAERMDNWPRLESLCVLSQVQAEAGMWDDALDTIRYIDDHYVQGKALRSIVKEQAEAKLWQEARATVNKIVDKCQRIEALGAIARCQAKMGLWQDAHNTIKIIPKGEQRAETLRAVVRAQAEFGLWQDAYHTAREIGADECYAYALRDIAKAQARAGLWEEAHATTRGVDVEEWLIETLEDIAKTHTLAGLFDAARAAAKQVGDVGLYHLAMFQIENEQWNEVKATATEIHINWQRVKIFAALAKAQAKIGRTDASANFLLARNAAEGVDYRGFNAESLRALTKVYIEARLWDAAYTTTKYMNNYRLRDDTLYDIAVGQATIGLWEKARIILDLVDRVASSDILSRGLQHIALSQAEAGLWEDAYNTIASITSSWHVESLCEVMTIQAVSQAKAGLWEDAYNTIASITSPWHVKGLCEVMIIQARAGLWKDVYSAVKRFGDDGLLALVKSLGDTGRWEEASDTLRDMMNPDQRVKAFHSLAQAQVTKGLWKDARTSINHIKEIEATIAHIAGTRRSEEVRCMMAKEQARLKLWEEARLTIADIKDLYQRRDALHALTVAQAESGLWDEVQRTISDIDSDESVSRDIAVIQARAGLWQEAFDTVWGIRSDWHQANALSSLVDLQAKAGLWDDAYTTLRKIDQEWSQAEALRHLHAELIRTERVHQACQKVGAIWRLSRTPAELLTMAQTATPLILDNPILGEEIAESFAWVDAQLRAD